MHNYGEVQRKHARSGLRCVSVCVCACVYVVYACLRTCACVYAWYSSDSLFIMLRELVLSVKWGMRECVLHSEWERQLSWACPLTPHHHSAIAFAAGKELKIEALTRLPKRLIVKPRYPLGQATCLPVTGLHKHLNDVPPSERCRSAGGTRRVYNFNTCQAHSQHAQVLMCWEIQNGGGNGRTFVLVLERSLPTALIPTAHQSWCRI